MNVTLPSTTTPGQSEPENNGNEGVLQNWSLATRCNLVSYPRYFLSFSGDFYATVRDTICVF